MGAEKLKTGMLGGALLLGLGFGAGLITAALIRSSGSADPGATRASDPDQRRGASSDATRPSSNAPGRIDAADPRAAPRSGAPSEVGPARAPRKRRNHSVHGPWEDDPDYTVKIDAKDGNDVYHVYYKGKWEYDLTVPVDLRFVPKDRPETIQERDVQLAELQSSDPEARMKAAFRLDAWLREHPQDRDVVAALGAVLERETDPRVVLYAAKAIGPIALDEGFAAFLRAIENNGDRVARYNILKRAHDVFHDDYPRWYGVPEAERPRLAADRKRRLAEVLDRIAAGSDRYAAEMAKDILAGRQPRMRFPSDDGRGEQPTFGGK